jgi:hypothetical protein
MSTGAQEQGKIAPRQSEEHDPAEGGLGDRNAGHSDHRPDAATTARRPTWEPSRRHRHTERRDQADPLNTATSVPAVAGTAPLDERVRSHETKP